MVQGNRLRKKYNVHRVDGLDAKGEKHYGCHCYVLDLEHDPAAIPVMLAYANWYEAEGMVQFAEDIRTMLRKIKPDY